MNEYVIADKNDIEAYWFERNITTLEIAREKAKIYPKANVIIEYKPYMDPALHKANGVIPTGRVWPVAKANQGATDD